MDDIPIKKIWPPALLVLLSLVLFIRGCGGGRGDIYPVTGTVKFSDGRPLTSGTIEFELKNSKEMITAQGIIEADGSFTLGTLEEDDGAPLGEYAITIFSESAIGSGHERPGMLEEKVLHTKYQDARFSGLKREVEATDNVFDFQVEYHVENETEEDELGTMMTTD